jgi:alpha-L-arabinofuranosidase
MEVGEVVPKGATEMREVKVKLNRSNVIGTTDRRLFRAFAKHLGRCICGGLHEAGHPSATPEGFRRDMLELAPTIGDRIIMQKSRVVE